MKKELKRFVTFLAPGSFLAENWSRDVDSLDPYAIEWPNNAYAFTLHEREDIVDGDARFTGKARQIGPTYYHPDSTIETLDEVKANPKAGAVLVSNMQINRWDRVVWSRWGNWPQPYKDGEVKVL